MAVLSTATGLSPLAPRSGLERSDFVLWWKTANWARANIPETPAIVAEPSRFRSVPTHFALRTGPLASVRRAVGWLASPRRRPERRLGFAVTGWRWPSLQPSATSLTFWPSCSQLCPGASLAAPPGGIRQHEHVQAGQQQQEERKQRRVDNPAGRASQPMATKLAMTVSVKAWTASGGPAEHTCGLR